VQSGAWVMIAPKGVELDASQKADADFTTNSSAPADITGLDPVTFTFIGLPIYVSLAALGVRHNTAAGKVGVALAWSGTVDGLADNAVIRNEFVPCAVSATDYPLATLTRRLSAEDGLVVGHTYSVKGQTWAQSAGTVTFRTAAASPALLWAEQK
jgi:hypothetical protein